MQTIHLCFIEQNSRTRSNGALMSPIKKEKKQCESSPSPILESCRHYCQPQAGYLCWGDLLPPQPPSLTLFLADAGALSERRWRSLRAKPAPDFDTRSQAVLLFHSRTPRFEPMALFQVSPMFCNVFLLSSSCSVELFNLFAFSLRFTRSPPDDFSFWEVTAQWGNSAFWYSVVGLRQTNARESSFAESQFLLFYLTCALLWNILTPPNIFHSHCCVRDIYKKGKWVRSGVEIDTVIYSKHYEAWHVWDKKFWSLFMLLLSCHS